MITRQMPTKTSNWDEHSDEMASVILTGTCTSALMYEAILS